MREFEGEAFERLLDEELGRSAAVKPQDGFEGRVLEQVRAADEERVGRGWPSRRDIGWLGGLAACGLAGALAVLPLQREWEAPKMLGPSRVERRSTVIANSGRDNARPSGSGSAGGRGRVGVRARGFRQARSFGRLGAAVGGGAELVALQVPGHRDEEASLALVRQYAKQASEGLGEPEDLAVRPLQFAEVKVVPLGGSGGDRGSSTMQENSERSDR